MGRILLDDPAHPQRSTLLSQQNVNGFAQDEGHQGLVAKIKQWAADINAMTLELYAGTTAAPPSASVTLAATVDDLAVAAGTRRLIFTPNAGGSTVNGIVLAGVVDGMEVEIFNDSATDSVAFATEALTSTDIYRFKGPALGVAIGPGSGAIARYIVNRWRFV